MLRDEWIVASAGRRTGRCIRRSIADASASLSTSKEQGGPVPLCGVGSFSVSKWYKDHVFIAPRKPKSVWSTLNKDRVVQLIANKSMTTPGSEKVDAAEGDGSRNALDTVGALEIPEDLKNAFTKVANAKGYFDAFPPRVQKNILQWISSAKTEATRSKRVAETIRLAAMNIRADQYQK